MATPAAQSFDFLTGAEAEFDQSAMTELAERSWAKPLLAEIEAGGGLKTENKAKLFDLFSKKTWKFSKTSLQSRMLRPSTKYY